MKNNITATQIRLPEETYKYILQEAERVGISANAMMLVLMEQGRKVWNGTITFDQAFHPAE